MPKITLDHCAIRTTKLEETRAFYEDLLGLAAGDRPQLPVPGYWLYDGQRPVVHLIEIRQEDKVDVFGEPLMGDKSIGARNGLDHVAFRVVGLDTLRGRLAKRKISYKEMDIPQMRLHQIFIQDPNGITTELNFFLDDETA